jgi:D-alanyl-D-alanine carboxypeptidase
MQIALTALALALQTPDTLVMDAQAADLLSETGSPGAALALDCGAGVLEGVAGLRIAGTDAVIQRGDLWHLGSNTKAMTATLAARLVDRGVISWDATVGATLGAAYAEIHPQLEDATLAELLAHQGGFISNAGVITALRLAGADADRDLAADRRRYAEAVFSEPGGPRGAFRYSNAGYVIAALMMEAVTETPYEQLMEMEVFEPLGMGAAGWGPPGEPGAADQPRGHRAGLLGGLQAREPGGGADNPPAMNPAGRAHMPFEDLLGFLRAHAARPESYLSPDSWSRLQTPVGESGYALGWGVRESGMLSHAGSNTMWYMQMAVDPASGCVAGVAVNDGRIDQVSAPVSDALTALLRQAAQPN